MKSFYQSMLLFFTSLGFLSFVFDLLWAIVILFTIYLIEETFNKEEYYKRIDTKSTETNQTTIQFCGYQRQQEQHITHTMLSKNEQKNTGLFGFKKGDSKPSLMSLIHGKHLNAGTKENHRPFSPNQPLLAVVKNNMYLRRSSSGNISNKAPLYRNIQPPVAGRNYSGYPNVLSPQLKAGFYSPVLQDSPALYGSPNRNESFNTTSNGLEVHGSYFINKSLLQERDEEVKSFSLINKSFNSPPRVNEYMETETDDKNKPVYKYLSRSDKIRLDKTTTESVVSVLKEKSKRKRQLPCENNESAKKTRFNTDTFDSTLNELFPPIDVKSASLRREKLSTVRSSKKRYVTTGTQYEENGLNRDEESVVKKARKIVSTPRSESAKANLKYGLSEQETNELMDNSDIEFSKKSPQDFDSKIMDEKSVIEDAIGAIKGSLKSSESNSSKKVTFHRDSIVNESEDDLSFQTPSKQKSALSNLKSPYKKLLAKNFPSNLKPDSTEKRRKHPVYFTAKIDIDEIQSNREEYGERGASLKAFRLDQEEAARRVNDLLDDSEECEGTKKTLGLSFNTGSSGLTFAVGNATTMQSTGLLAALNQPVKVPPTISFSAATPIPQTKENTINTTSTGFALPPSITSAATGSTVAKNVTFNLGSATAISTQPISSSGFSFTASTVPSSSVVSLPTATTTLSATGFLFGQANTPSTTGSGGLTSVTTASTGLLGGQFSLGTLSSPLPTTFTKTYSSLKSAETLPFSYAATSQSISSSTQNSSTSVFPFTSVASTGDPKTSITFLSQASNIFATTGLTTNNASFGGPTTTASNMFGITQSSDSTNASIFALSTSVASSVNGNPSSAITTPQSCFSFSNGNGFNFGTTATSTASIFGLPTSTAATSTIVPQFGKLTTTASTTALGIFNNTLNTISTTKSIFGLPVSTVSQSVFGTTTSVAPKNVFDAPVASSKQNVFGNTSNSNVFGASTTSSVFGATTTASFFGTTTTASVFGATTTASVFGATTTASVFGTTTTAGVFGATTTASVFGTTTTASVFGTTTTASVFGATTTASVFCASNSVFGNSSASSVFGNSTTTAAVSGFSFGSTTTSSKPGSTGFSFGMNPQSSVFGAPSAPSFGSSNTGFGQSTAAAPPPFGSTNKSSVFAAQPSSTQTINPFGQTQSTAGFDFSASMKQGPTFNFGASAPSNNAFGTPQQQAAKSFSFGNGPATPSFGNVSNTPSFTTPHQSPFGTPQVPSFGTPTFNTPVGANGFSMGVGAPTSRPVAQRARRRIKK